MQRIIIICLPLRKLLVRTATDILYSSWLCVLWLEELWKYESAYNVSRKFMQQMSLIEHKLIVIHMVGIRGWFRGEFQPRFWKKSLWNESGDCKEKVSGRAENPSQVSGIGLSAPANGPKNLQKFHVIEMVLQPELKKEGESYAVRLFSRKQKGLYFHPGWNFSYPTFLNGGWIIILLCSFELCSPKQGEKGLLALRQKNIQFGHNNGRGRASAWSKCAIHYICKNYSTHTQFNASVSERESSKHNILVTKLRFSTGRSSFQWWIRKAQKPLMLGIRICKFVTHSDVNKSICQW